MLAFLLCVVKLDLLSILLSRFLQGIAISGQHPALRVFVFLPLPVALDGDGALYSPSLQGMCSDGAVSLQSPKV